LNVGEEYKSLLKALVARYGEPSEKLIVHSGCRLPELEHYIWSLGAATKLSPQGHMGRLDHTATALFAAPYLARLPERVLRWSRELERAGADLVISDFEPLLPRAARQAGVPHSSVDHQHFLVAYDLSSLRPELRLRAELLAQAGAAVLLGSEAHDRFGLLLSVAQGSAGGGHARWRSLAA